MRDTFYQRAAWRLAFAWLPHRSARLKKFIWLQEAYLGTASWCGLGETIYEYRWLTPDEYLLTVK